jgi:ATP-dependent DNA helicase DinG
VVEGPAKNDARPRRVVRPQRREGERVTELKRERLKIARVLGARRPTAPVEVDVPGSALSQVIITRLPFEVPTHPSAEARAEWVRSHGGNPFTELNLPDALIKFRQGIGRLIRKNDDQGVVTLLDSRLLHKSYGRHFLGCLPIENFLRLTMENRESQFRPFE